MKDCLKLEVGYMFNEQFIYLVNIVFWTQLLIRFLNSSMNLEFFVSVGTFPHSFGPFSTWYAAVIFRTIP